MFDPTHLPNDLRELVHRLIFDERHLLARLLSKQLTRTVNEASNAPIPVLGPLVTHACRLWLAIHALNCVDEPMRLECRRNHDVLYQILEDPYDMRGGIVPLREAFLAVEPRMLQ